MNGECFFKLKIVMIAIEVLCGAGILNLNKNQTGQGNQKSIFFMCVSWNYSLCRALDDDSRNDSNLFTYR